jgi:hypothetical protein
VSQEKGERRRDEEDYYQYVLELLKEDFPGGGGLRGPKLVRAVLG